MDGKLKVFILSKESLDLFFLKLATLKILATQSENVERRDSGFVMGPTSIGVTNFNFGSAEFKENLKSEIKILWQRFRQVIQREKKEDQVTAAQAWLNEQLRLCRKHFESYSTRIDELNATNQLMIRALGFGVFAGSIAQASAEIALILTGIGLPTNGLIIKVVAEKSVKQYLKKFVLSFAAGTTISVIEDWEKAKNADVFIVASAGTNYVTNTQGFYEDAYKELAAQNQTKVEQLGKEIEVIKKSNLNSRAMSYEIAKRGTPQADLQGTKAMMLRGASKTMTRLGWLLAFKGTYDSLAKLEKHCNYEI